MFGWQHIPPPELGDSSAPRVWQDGIALCGAAISRFTRDLGFAAVYIIPFDEGLQFGHRRKAVDAGLG
jgi:hypothetical protein